MALRPRTLGPGLVAGPAGLAAAGGQAPQPASGTPGLQTRFVDARTGASWTLAQLAEALSGVLVPAAATDPAPPPASYPFAALANPVHLAFSARTLRGGYAGAWMTARRSSDNAEQDFAFDAQGAADVAGLTGFCGAGDGFCSRWYDQSGAGRHATQTDPARQPQIVAAGAVLLLGGQPALSWPANRSARLDTPLSGVANQFAAVAAISNAVPTSQYGSRLLSYLAAGDSNDYSTPTSIDALDIRLGRTLSTYVANAAGYNPSVAIAAGPQVVSAFIDGTGGGVRVYGGPQGTAATSGAFGPSGTVIIGNDTGGEPFRGLIGELVVQIQVSIADLGALEAGAAAFFGIN